MPSTLFNKCIQLKSQPLSDFKLHSFFKFISLFYFILDKKHNSFFDNNNNKKSY